MNSEIQQAIDHLSNVLREHAPTDATSCHVFVNCEGTTVEMTRRDSTTLKKMNVSMRNLRGDFIR